MGLLQLARRLYANVLRRSYGLFGRGARLEGAHTAQAALDVISDVVDGNI
jgi:hypothetical protein